jgi:hypothetical protein
MLFSHPPARIKTEFHRYTPVLQGVQDVFTSDPGFPEQDTSLLAIHCLASIYFLHLNPAISGRGPSSAAARRRSFLGNHLGGGELPE